MLGLCSQPFATVGNRRQPFAIVLAVTPYKALRNGECIRGGLQDESVDLRRCAVLLAFAEELSARSLCGTAVLVAFGEEVSL